LFARRGITISDAYVAVRVTTAFQGTHNATTLKAKLSPAGAGASSLTLKDANGLLTTTTAGGGSFGDWNFGLKRTAGSGKVVRIDPKALDDVIVIFRYTIG
jgi:hypothetical protein